MAFLVAGATLCPTTAGQAQEGYPIRTSGSRTKPLASLTSYSLQTVQLSPIGSEGAATASTLPLERTASIVVGGESVRLLLHPWNARASGFQVLAQDGDGQVREIPSPAVSTWRGVVDGHEKSTVVASLTQDGLSARIALDPQTIWHVEPALRFLEGAAAAEHVVYRDEDLVPIRWGCGADHPVTARSAFDTFAAASTGTTAATGTKVCDIAFDADFEFYQSNGSSVANTVHDIEDILNRVAQLYEDQLNVTFELTAIVVRTAEPDPYSSTNHDTLLAQMRNEWNLNRTTIHRDIAHLMTGKEIDGVVIGSTFTGTLCEVCGTARGYGFSQSKFSPSIAQRVCVTAHELGHSFGASHCDGDPDCYIMCSFLNACGGSCTQFGSRTKSSIAEEVALSSCLAAQVPPMDLPFCDPFDSVVDGSKWSFNNVATISLAASNPPTPPSALLLDNCCSPCGSAPDEIRSNEILLGVLPAATLTYFTEHLGNAGTAGSRLFVEYWSDSGVWMELNVLTANGTTQTSFVEWEHGLPADALHDAFRLRFRVERAVNQAAWFIDNVSIAGVSAAQPVLYVRAGGGPGGNGGTWASAFTDLQDAISVAACSRGVVEEIRVAAGTYRPDGGTGDRGATFRMQAGTALLGGYAGTGIVPDERNPSFYPSVLSGAIGSPSSGDNSYHVVTSNYVDSSAVLDGFIITGGQADGTAPDDSGGGLLNVSGAPTIRRCMFVSNWARTGGAVANKLAASPFLTDCLFQGNHATSAGGVLHSDDDSVPSISRGRFLMNSATAAGGAIFTRLGEIRISDSLFSGNTSASGGAIQNFGTSATLTNCTLSKNHTSGLGGAVTNISSGNSLDTCILWGNTNLAGSDQTAQVSGSDPSVQRTLLQGWTGSFGGGGNSGSNPLFIDADGPDNVPGTLDDNLRVLAGSPAVDTGDPDFIPDEGASDLDGHLRVLCDAVDRGAYEFGIGDYDCDRAVDWGDFSEWADCMTGPNNGPIPSRCRVFDFDGDDDVDLDDQADFQRVFAPNGP